MATGDQAVTVLLAEYSSLRAEIDRRSQAQHTLLNIALTLSGALAAYAVTNDSVAVVLLQPIVVCALGMLYADHGFMIRRIGLYVGTHTADRADRLTGEHKLLHWEDSPHRNTQGAWLPMWLTAPTLIFILSPIALVLVSLWVRLVSPAAEEKALLSVPLPVVGLLWAIDLLMIGLACFAFFRAFSKHGLDRTRAAIGR